MRHLIELAQEGVYTGVAAVLLRDMPLIRGMTGVVGGGSVGAGSGSERERERVREIN